MMLATLVDVMKSGNRYLLACKLNGGLYLVYKSQAMAAEPRVQARVGSVLLEQIWLGSDAWYPAETFSKKEAELTLVELKGPKGLKRASEWRIVNWETLRNMLMTLALTGKGADEGYMSR